MDMTPAALMDLPTGQYATRPASILDEAPVALPRGRNPDAGLMRLCLQILENRREADRLIALEEEGAGPELRRALLQAAIPLAHASEALLAELMDTPATTLAGLRAKGEVLADHVGLNRAPEAQDEDRIAWSLAEDLLRLIPPAAPRGAGGAGQPRPLAWG